MSLDDRTVEWPGESEDEEHNVKKAAGKCRIDHISSAVSAHSNIR